MKIILAGGGTGGHLFPGIALAQAFQQTSVAGSRILPRFLCTDRPFDAQQLTRYGFSYDIIPAPRLTGNISFLVKLIRSIWLSYHILRREQPGLIIGLGGYGSVPTLIAARLLSIPTVLLEQNFLPGKVTRWFSAWARYVFYSWPGSQKYLTNPLRARLTGSPLREEIKRLDRGEALKRLRLDPTKKILVVMGGSQGAEVLNQFMLENIAILEEFSTMMGIIHLTGKTDYLPIKQAYQKAGLSHYVVDFCQEMALVYSSADLVLSRAGGIALAEMTAMGLPMVLVPFPHATEDHQRLNAWALSRYGAAELIPQTQLGPDKMRYLIKDILFNPFRLKQMSQASQTCAYLQATQEIISFLFLKRSLPRQLPNIPIV